MTYGAGVCWEHVERGGILIYFGAVSGAGWRLWPRGCEDLVGGTAFGLLLPPERCLLVYFSRLQKLRSRFSIP